jgi:hypothetical protein
MTDIVIHPLLMFCYIETGQKMPPGMQCQPVPGMQPVNMDKVGPGSVQTGHGLIIEAGLDSSMLIDKGQSVVMLRFNMFQ